MNYQANKIIHDLEDENPQGASDNIKTLLNQKVAEMLDRKKPEVASLVGVDENTSGAASQALDVKDQAVIRAFLKQKPLKGENLISTNKKVGDYDQGHFHLDDKTGDIGIAHWYSDDDGELKVAVADVGWMVKATPTTVLSQQEILQSAPRRSIGYKASGVEKDLGRYLKKWEQN